LSKKSCVIRKEALDSTLVFRYSRSVSRSGASGWTSGKQAPPIEKSQREEMNAASSVALPRPPSGWTKSGWPRGGSPRRAKTFSIPAASIRSSVAARPCGLADAAQVGHRLQAQIALQRPRDLGRAVAGRAAGAVGDRDEVGLQLAQRARRRVELLGRLLRLRREELDREDRPLGIQYVVDSHAGRVTAPACAVISPQIAGTLPPHP